MTVSKKRIFIFILSAILIAVCAALGAGIIPVERFTLLAKAEPPQTYTIRSSDEFNAYARAYRNGERNPEDVIIVSINIGEAITDEHFISLGTSSRPFAGTVTIPAAGVDTFNLYNCPLFDYVSTDLKITGAGVVKIMRSALPETSDAGVLRSGSLFANHVVKGTYAAEWNITLVSYSGEGEEAPSFEGLIGDMASNCNVTVNFINNSDMPVVSPYNAGLICNTLGGGAALSVTTAGSGGNISVSGGGHAGGIAGQTGNGATICLGSDNNSRVNAVTSSGGYAGGIAGYAEELTVTFAAGINDYTAAANVTGHTGAGGLFGYYKKTCPYTFDMADLSVMSGARIGGSGFSGGVIGYLENAGGTFTFEGNKAFYTVTVNVAGGSDRGGVIGVYKASALTDTLILQNFDIAVTSETGRNSGGLIGRIDNRAAYVQIRNNSVTVSGGVDGGLIATAGSTGAFIDVSGEISVSGRCDAGLIGTLNEGILRIAGVTDLSGLNQNSSNSGLIVKKRDRALVYALGDGAGISGDWALKRNLSNSIDDIRSWGEVLRLDGSILRESDLFIADGSAHTVTVKAAVRAMGNVTHFALTALNIQLNKTAVGALNFLSGSDSSAALLSGTLSLTADISLAGTGLTGLTRDDGANNPFSGTFLGNDHTITLATGEPYGLDGAGGALSSNSGHGNIYGHSHSGLFAKIGGGASVRDLTISGKMNISQNADGLCAGGIAAEAGGSVTLSGCFLDLELSYKTSDNYGFLFGGGIGTAKGDSLSVTVTGGEFSPAVTDITETPVNRGKNTWIGGAIGTIGIGGTDSPSQSVSFNGTAFGLNYTKTLNSKRESCFGGVIAKIDNSTYVNARRTVSLDAVTLSLDIEGVAADGKFGGLLGTEWLSADVTIYGLTVYNTAVTATGTAADYGGLVRVATGMWNIRSLSVTSCSYTLPSNGSSFGFAANKTYSEDGVTVGSGVRYPKVALYLEIDNTGSNYDIGALSFGGTVFSRFDEIAASSVASDSSGANVEDNSNSVISIKTSGNAIDTSGNHNTYLNKTAYGRTAAGAINNKTRYYYNIAYARSNLSTAKYGFLVWSVGVYAHESIKAWFAAGNSFTGDLDMTGLSYYPVDLSGGSASFGNAAIKLDNILMEANVRYAYTGYSARSTRTNDNQHYLMHASLFHNVTSTLTLGTVTLKGNVPKLSDDRCGFLVSGTVGGYDQTKAKCNFNSVTLDGVYISNGDAYLTSASYAPLTVNKIGKNTNFGWDGASQTSGYSDFAANGRYAGSSLIGNVGNGAARAIYLTFAGLALDGRSSATPIDNLDACYNTTKSIFSRATILNAFMYFSESSGSYNFTDTEDRTGPSTATHAVTYGREITASAENADLQKRYYVSEYYVHPSAYRSNSPYDFSAGFLPYVYAGYDLSEYKHELSINISVTSTIEGCGKYGDPFVIDEVNDLIVISKIISGVAGTAGSELYFPSDLTLFDHTSTAYIKKQYEYDETEFIPVSGANISRADAVKYLAGAYYVITNDIVLPSNYEGLGTFIRDVAGTDNPEYAFRGVIIGRGNPTVTNTSRSPFIKSSNGCVVQGITIEVDVDYNGSDAIDIPAPTGSAVYGYSGSGDITAYGAVIGQIMGGDTFIDNVKVVFSNISFNISADSTHFDTLTPIGGYVGVLVNGGLIFRNMAAEGPTDDRFAGLTSAKYDKVGHSGYLYVNPIIGRVIAGYAFYEGATYKATEAECTLKNGEKNYTISDLSLSESKMSVVYEDSKLKAAVPNGQAMFVLGAIVNSGSASAERGATERAYQGLSDYWSAYRAHTTARAGGNYSQVGESGFASSSDYTDYAVYDKYSADGVKVPYIIRAYTQKSGNVYLARCISRYDDTEIAVTGNCNVAQGFRGIGSIYISSDYVHLRISDMSGRIGETSNSYAVNLNMRFLEYNHRSVSSYIAVASGTDIPVSTAGFGLFNSIRSTSITNVRYLELSGSIFYDVYTISGVQAKYNFANYKNSDGYDRTERGNITSGNTEDATLRRTLLSVGGIIGVATSGFSITNVTFNDFSLEGAKTAGGLVGFTYLNKNNSVISRITYDDASVVNRGYVNVIGGLQAGGLIGRILRAAVEINGAVGGTDLTIKNVETKNTDPNETGMQYYANLNTGVGGIVGTCWSADGDGVEKPVSVSSATSVKRLWINGINVVKGENAANVRVLFDAGTKNNYAGGYIGSAHNVWIKITNGNLKNVNVTANVAGGFVGKITQKYYLFIENCEADGTDGSAVISGTRYAGGAVGWAIGRDTLYFQLLDFKTKNYTVRSTSTGEVQAGAGGAVGYAQGDNKGVNAAENFICEFNNITVLNCAIETNYANTTATPTVYKCGTGGLIGVIDTATDGNESSRNNSNKYKFSGYNILVKNCTFTHKDGGITDDSTSATNRRIGDIVGNNAIQSPLKLVGVSVQNLSYCGKHVGYNASDEDNYGSGGNYGAGYLVLANYWGVDTNHTFAGIDDVGTSSDNCSDVAASESFVTANPALDIGGVTLTGDGVASSVAALAVKNIISDGTSGRYGYAAKAYYAGNSGSDNLTVFTSFGEKFAMFSSEVSGYLGTDFPVLIVDDITRENTHKLINSYLRLLTNTTHDFGADLSNVYGVYIYKMTYDGGLFTPSYAGASLKRSSSGQFYMNNNEFDSGKTQFSLIDLRFYDPAAPTETAYHLYVPVFVKKVLSYEFNIAALSGTKYYFPDYGVKFGEALIENVGMPVTLGFGYTYSRSAAEWSAAINEGEKVNRNYQKKLLFYKANTNDILKSFPPETVLVLVDKNRGGKPYYSTVGDALFGNTLSLSAFREGFNRSGGTVTLSGESFSPLDLGDMLSLSVSQTGSGDKLVKCAAGDATVIAEGQGYRLADDIELADGSILKYTVTAGVNSLSENYYLSIFTESNAANDLLFHYYLVTSPTSFSETAYPSKMADVSATCKPTVHLVMGKIFYHDGFSVKSLSEPQGGEIMKTSSENNVLKVSLVSELGISDDLSSDIKSSLLPLIEDTDVFHSFKIYLNRKEGEDISKVIIGSPAASGVYGVDGILNGEPDISAIAYGVANTRVKQNYVEVVSRDLSNDFASGEKFEICAEVSLTYSDEALLAQFPARNDINSESGVTVSGSSNLAFSVTSTSYTKNSVWGEDIYPISYYTEGEPVVATLDLNPLGDKLGDFTPLGINASNNENASEAYFELLAVLDISNVSPTVSDYTKVSISVTLSEKNSSGEYVEVEDITRYLSFSLKDIFPAGGFTLSGAKCSAVLLKTEGISDNGAEITMPLFEFTVKTGAAFEGAGLNYSNYKIKVEVVLKNSEDSDYTVSRASNYVIYTNARVKPDYVTVDIDG